MNERIKAMATQNENVQHVENARYLAGGTLPDYTLPDELESCSMCAGLAILMGILGKKAWYRCQNCGIEFSIDL
jgi:tRNA(Arg) A34 adenosine deaminase TadA